MKKSNPNHNQNHNLKLRKEDDPRYERVVVGYRLIPMQAHHVDEIAAAEGRTDLKTAWWNALSTRPRCRKCFLRLPEGRKTHFCRWNFQQEGPRDPSPKMRQVPIYRWVLKKDHAG